MQMLYSDWLSHCTQSAISVQRLDVVDKIASFLRSFERTFRNKWVIIKFPRGLKGKHLGFLELKKLANF